MRFFAYICMLCMVYACSFLCEVKAQSASGAFTIQGDLYDALFDKGLDSAEVQLLTMDSVMVQTTMTRYDNESHGRYYVKGVGLGKYILRFSMEGYSPAYANVTVRKGTELVRMKNVMMHRYIPTVSKDIVLGEARVKASLIKMVYDKDTLVYNALAFKLAEGSMLDGLIKQLPGAEYKNGQIFVNGEMVQSLLVNGKDFFKGDPSIALENLPAYMVSKIKVFKREREDNKLPGVVATDAEKDLVMDVRLKKDFSTGWAANVQGGYGSHNRYLARLFGLRFTNNSRFSVYANLNNLNDSRVPGESADMGMESSSVGLTSRKKGGFMWGYDNKKSNVGINIEGHAQHQNSDYQRKQSSVSFLQDDVWSRSTSKWTTRDNLYNMSGEIKWRPDFWNKVSFFKLSPKVSFQDTETNMSAYAVQLSSEPYERYRGAVIDSVFLHGGSPTLNKSIINQLSNLSLMKSKKFNTSGYWTASPGFPMGKFFVKWDGNYSYGNSKIRSHTTYDLTYPDNAAQDIYHRTYIDNEIRNYTYDVNTYLGYINKGFVGRVIYTYKQDFNNNDRERFLLEQLADWSQGSNKPIGALPSTREEMLRVLDPGNTYYSTLMKFINKVNFDARYMWSLRDKDGNERTLSVQVQLPVRFQTDRLTYSRNEINVRNRNRRDVFLEPKVNISLGQLAFSYSLSHSAPDMIQMLPTRDDADPLNVRLGNDALSDMHFHTLALSKEWDNQMKNTMSSLRLGWNVVDNAVAMSRSYNPKTGVTVFKPENVGGNWNTSASFMTSLPVGKAKRMFLTNSASVTYANSVDLITNAQYESARSSVRKCDVTEDLRMTYNMSWGSLGGNLGVNWINLESKRDNFETVNCENWLLGANATISLPWRLSLSADVTATLRTGYDDSNMNKTTLICNARLSRSFLHGKLTVMIDAFDILDGIRDIYRDVNEQGRIETWYGSMGRYVMAHARYKFAKKPKKR